MTHSIDGVDVPIVDVSDLVILKVLAGRPKDLEDIRSLLRVQGSRIDVQRVRYVLGLLEDALGQSGLLTTFEQARARVHD